MNLTHRLEVLLSLSLVLSFFSWGKRILFPFQIFTTWVHECCHAVTALLLGGSAIKITIAPDGSGITHYKIPNGKIRQSIVASAGYLGASICGFLILLLTAQTERSNHFWNIHSMIFLFCGLIVFSLLFWIRNWFGFLSTLLLGGAIALLNYFPLNRYAHEALLFLGIQTALNALFDIRTLYGLGSGKGTTSDAHSLQRLFWLPHWFWSTLWLSMSVVIIYWTILKINL